jgi:cytochrome b561
MRFNMNESIVVDKSLESPKRYEPALVTLHWLIVVLVFTNLFFGLFEFEPALRGGGAFRIPESLIAVHIAVGLLILILLAARFIVRIRTGKPAPATAGSQTLNFLARLVHSALYVVVFAITVVGLIFSLQTNRLQRAFFGGGPRFAGPGNGNFGGFPTPGPGTPRPSFGNSGNNFQGFGNQPGGNPGFQGNGFRPGGRGGAFGAAFLLLPVHLYLAILLAVLIGIHILAAIYHQFVLRDHLIARMWYGKA